MGYKIMKTNGFREKMRWCSFILWFYKIPNENKWKRAIAGAKRGFAECENSINLSDSTETFFSVLELFNHATVEPIDKWFPQSESHIQRIIHTSIMSLV